MIYIADKPALRTRRRRVTGKRPYGPFPPTCRPQRAAGKTLITASGLQNWKPTT
jgi:hypothetical protein